MLEKFVRMRHDARLTLKREIRDIFHSFVSTKLINRNSTVEFHGRLYTTADFSK